MKVSMNNVIIFPIDRIMPTVMQEPLNLLVKPSLHVDTGMIDTHGNRKYGDLGSLYRLNWIKQNAIKSLQMNIIATQDTKF